MREYSEVRRKLPIFVLHARAFRFDPARDRDCLALYIGHGISMGMRCKLEATRSAILIGSRAGLGPKITIHGGNQRADEVGHFMGDISNAEKLPEKGLRVVIENDVWLRAQSTSLRGITMVRAAVVAGVPAKAVPTIKHRGYVGGLYGLG